MTASAPARRSSRPRAAASLAIGIAVLALTCAICPPLARAEDAPTPAEPPATAVNPAVRLPAMQLTEVQPSHGALTDVPGDDLRLPPHSGTDRRVVYSKTIMRVWLVDADGSILHTHRVSGRLSQPRTGTYTVFSRSPVTCNRYSTNVCMRYMVRFAIGRGGDNIGFHEIPRRSGVPVMSEADLGGAVSSGCVRQATNDAQLMWAWAQVGTVVVVTP